MNKTDLAFGSETIVKRMLWLAYEAASPMGMGFLHANDSETEETVWKQSGSGEGKVHGDYIAGRMMKIWGLRYDKESIDIPEDELRRDYQSWGGTYASYEVLYLAAVGSLS